MPKNWFMTLGLFRVTLNRPKKQTGNKSLNRSAVWARFQEGRSLATVRLAQELNNHYPINKYSLTGLI
jgi:hypothetical protein